jgi:hypothetical protein
MNIKKLWGTDDVTRKAIAKLNADHPTRKAIAAALSFRVAIKVTAKGPSIKTPSIKAMLSVEKIAANGFTAADYEGLGKLGITPEIIERARLERVTREDAEKLGIFLNCDGGINFSYFLPPVNGNNTTKPVYYAVRQDKPPVVSGEVDRKYLFAPGKTYPYFAPADPAWYDKKVPAIIVESQKAALSILRWAEDNHRPLLPIGINGCWGWSGQVGIAPNEAGEREAQNDILDLLASCCRSRRVYLLYDANEATSVNVRVARDRLAQRLLRKITGDVRLLHLPPAVGAPWNGPDDFIGECGDDYFRDLFEQVEIVTPGVVESVLVDTSAVTEIKDMPAECMSGELGEIYEKHMSGFPRAFAYPALLANASALVQDRAPGVRTNIYVINVGKSRTGKTEADMWARTILGVYDTNILRAFVGSAEQFAVNFGDAGGNSRLFNPDEAAHLLEKAMIEHAAWPTLLQRAWGEDSFEVTVSRQKKTDERHPINMHLSIYGGIVEEKFEDCFTSASIYGFYQRVFFGLGPTDFVYNYRPVPEELRGRGFRGPSAVTIDPEVWKQLDEWRKPLGTEFWGIPEVCLRASVIAAAFDRKKTLQVSDLEPLRHMIEYQKYARTFLKPNTGVTIEGKITDRIINHLRKLQPGHGVTRRELYRETNIHRLGVSCADRVIGSLVANQIVRATKGKRGDSEILSINRDWGDGK